MKRSNWSVVEPVATLLELDYLSRLEVNGAPLFLRVRRPAIGAIEQQRGARDRTPQRLDEFVGDILDRPDIQVRIELPAIGAVLVAV